MELKELEREFCDLTGAVPIAAAQRSKTMFELSCGTVVKFASVTIDREQRGWQALRDEDWQALKRAPRAALCVLLFDKTGAILPERELILFVPVRSVMRAIDQLRVTANRYRTLKWIPRHVAHGAVQVRLKSERFVDVTPFRIDDAERQLWRLLRAQSNGVSLQSVLPTKPRDRHALMLTLACACERRRYVMVGKRDRQKLRPAVLQPFKSEPLLDPPVRQQLPRLELHDALVWDRRAAIPSLVIEVEEGCNIIQSLHRAQETITRALQAGHRPPEVLVIAAARRERTWKRMVESSVFQHGGLTALCHFRSSEALVAEYWERYFACR